MAILTVRRQSEIELQARKVFEKYRHFVENFCGDEVGPRGVIPVRTDLIIARIYKLPLRRERFIQEGRGMTVAGRYDGTEILIVEGKNVGPTRSNEAHEIGHMVLHPGETHLRERGSAPRPLKEHEADCFAANLLMPRELAMDEFASRFSSGLSRLQIDENAAHALTNGKLPPSQIRKMSSRQFAELIAQSRWFNGRHFDSMKDVFGVSCEAMAWRLIELRLVID